MSILSSRSSLSLPFSECRDMMAASITQFQALAGVTESPLPLLVVKADRQVAAGFAAIFKTKKFFRVQHDWRAETLELVRLVNNCEIYKVHRGYETDNFNDTTCCQSLSRLCIPPPSDLQRTSKCTPESRKDIVSL